MPAVGRPWPSGDDDDDDDDDDVYDDDDSLSPCICLSPVGQLGCPRQ